MTGLCLAILSPLRRLWREEHGQEGIEYLLALGAFAIPIVAALIIAFQVIAPEILGNACTTTDPLGSSAHGECLTDAAPVPP